MLSRTPDFQKFSSPSELGVPVAVGDAWRLPSQCLPESSNTKLSNSQQHPKAFPFSFTSTQRLPKMSRSIYSPFASMCQALLVKEKKALLWGEVSLLDTCFHISLSSLHPETSKWISDSHQHVTPYYWLALLCWCPLTLGFQRSAPQPSQANTWVCQPGQKALQRVGAVLEHLWRSVSIPGCPSHFSCKIWCSRYLWYRMMSMHPNLYQAQRLGSVRHWKPTPRSGFCFGSCLHAWMATKGPLK